MRALGTLLLAATLASACESVTLIWMPHSQRADPLFAFFRNGRTGYIDARGHIVIRPTLDGFHNEAPHFYEGLAGLGPNGYPLLTRKDKKILFAGYKNVWDFSEGLAAAIPDGESHWGYIDPSGRFVIPPRFPSYPQGLVSDFSEGRAAIEVEGKLGYIDRTGNYVIPPRFAAGTPFESGLARVVLDGPCYYLDYDNSDPCIAWSPQIAPSTHPPGQQKAVSQRACRWTYIDKTGQPVFKTTFTGALPFRESLAAAKTGELWGFINRQGEFVIPPAFKHVHSFSNGRALVETESSSGFIDTTGALVIPTDYHKAEPFSEGLAAIGTPDDGYIYIDTTGRQAIPQRFALASRFHHGLAHVKLNRDTSPYAPKGDYAYIDKTGKRVFTYRR